MRRPGVKGSKATWCQAVGMVSTKHVQVKAKNQVVVPLRPLDSYATLRAWSCLAVSNVAETYGWCEVSRAKMMRTQMLESARTATL